MVSILGAFMAISADASETQVSSAVCLLDF
jgi:hypothetical protein